MGVEENLRAMDEAIESFNARDLERHMRLYAESVIQYAPGLTEPLKGRAAIRARLENFLAAFPDLRWNKERSFGQADWVCTEMIFTGTHEGTLHGPGGLELPPTNQPVRFRACVVVKVEGGEAVEVHSYWDVSELLTQIVPLQR